MYIGDGMVSPWEFKEALLQAKVDIPESQVLLYCFFTTALLLLYYCFTTALGTAAG